MSISKKILIVAGEESGDMYGANIIHKLSKNQNITFYAMGSSKIQMTNAKMIVDSSKLSVVGFFEILRIYPKLLNALIKIKKSVDEIKPDLLILIDYQEFNFKIAKYAKSKGIKILFYISPQVWAWRENRIKKIKNYIDIMAVIFPFEKSYYKKYDVKVEYVGHPLIENEPYKQQNFIGNNHRSGSYIGFFPGSRMGEIKKHAPIIKKTIQKILEINPNEKFLISKSHNIDISIYENYFSKHKNTEIIENNDVYETIDLCKVAVAASGTITLQIALMKVPMCVFYKISFLTYFIAKTLVKINSISLVNIIMGNKIVKEFIQKDANEENLSKEINKLTKDESYKKNMLKNFLIIEKKLKDEPSKISIYELINRML